ncbi:hypothetical protein [Bacillus toyonensis]|uniref:hypothetical protein n=1 Tax=Bacillus toyonensis TaxID=155322 RepID=UPI000BFE9DE0|nr:hypothetical protein [Bacillus toyonensis]PHG07401.1 hypothetical protein COI66_17490 [Bacillus toyonensis]
MNDIRSKMELREIEARLKRISGENFQEHVRFILKISDNKFRVTRIAKDSGIDGFKLYNTGKKNQRKVIEIYSMHTKSPGAKTKIKKMIEDFENATKFAKKHNYILKKWYMVSNYEISTEEKIQFIKLCDSQNIEFEDLNPATLITLFNNELKIFHACCFFGAIYAPKSPYSDYSDHKFIEAALKDICEYRKKTWDEKHQLLKDIISNIFQICFIDNSRLTYNVNNGILATISKRRIPKNFIEWYHILSNEFIKCPFPPNIVPLNFFYKDKENKKIYLYAKNLSPLYVLCLALQNQLLKTGDYNIENALNTAYKSAENIRKQIFQKYA